MTEIDPTCTDNLMKQMFVQKLRCDISTRLDTDVNLSLHDVVRKAQNIEFNIEYQKVDKKVRSVVQQEKENPLNLITHNLSMSTNRRPSSQSSHISSSSNDVHNPSASATLNHSPANNISFRRTSPQHRANSSSDVVLNRSTCQILIAMASPIGTTSSAIITITITIVTIIIPITILLIILTSLLTTLVSI